MFSSFQRCLSFKFTRFPGMAVLLLAVLVSGAAAADDHASYSIDVFDVGTGLSVLVRGPSWNVLFDGGTNDDNFKSEKDNRLLAAIPAAGLAKGEHIDYMILSHPHTDHDSLLDGVLDNYSVGEIWDSGAVNVSCTYYDFLKAVQDEQRSSSKAVYRTALHAKGNTKMPDFKGKSSCYKKPLTLTYGEQLIGADRSRDNPTQVTFADGAKMTLLYATDPDAKDYNPKDKSYNDFSFVVGLELGAKTVLLTGDAQGGSRATPLDHPDAEHSIERKLLDCCFDLLPADLLVVGHHGSETSSRNEFLDAVDGRDTREAAEHHQPGAPAPKGPGANIRTMHYVISAGPHKYSSVQLPDEVVVEDLRARFDEPDQHVWRTDLHDLACDDKDNNVAQCPAQEFTPCSNRNPKDGKKIGVSKKSGRYGGCDNVRVSIEGSEMTVSYWP